MIRILSFNAKVVAARDIGPFQSIMRTATVSPDVTRQLRGTFVLTFPDHESAEVVYALPEVAAFLRDVVAAAPYIPYFLVAHPQLGQLHMLVAAHAPASRLTTSDSMVALEFDDALLDLLASWLLETRQLAERVADDPRPLLSEIVAGLDPALGRNLVDHVMAV